MSGRSFGHRPRQIRTCPRQLVPKAPQQQPPPPPVIAQTVQQPIQVLFQLLPGDGQQPVQVVQVLPAAAGAAPVPIVIPPVAQQARPVPIAPQPVAPVNPNPPPPPVAPVPENNPPAAEDEDILPVADRASVHGIYTVRSALDLISGSSF